MIMNRLFLLFFSLFVLTASAQNDSTPEPVIRFGYLSYESVFMAMPEYAAVEQQMKELQASYEKEMQRVEEEFNKKYEAFLEGQKDFPRTILLKRQTELEQLMKQNIEFKNESRRALQKAREEALQPVRTRLAEALAAVAAELRLALIINTDANACPFIDPQLGVNVQEQVGQKLQGE